MAEIFANTSGAIGLAKSMTEGVLTVELFDTSKLPAALLGTGTASEFRIIIDEEIMMVTNRETTTKWKVTRGLEGTTKVSHAINSIVYHKLTAGAVETIVGKISAGVTELRAKEIAAEEAAKAKSLVVPVVSLPYTVKATDEGKTIEVNVTTPGQVIIPKSVFGVGAEFYITQVGSAKFEVVGESTFTEVKIPAGLHPKSDAVNSTVVMRRSTGSAPERWFAAGDLEI